MGLSLSRLLTMFVIFTIFLPISPVRGQELEAPEATPEAPAPPRRPDSPSIYIHVTDLPSAWQAMRETRLRQSIESIFALPFIAGDDSVAALNASIAAIAERGGIEPTVDSLVGENTRQLRFTLFDEEDLEDPSQMPYILEATMTSPRLAAAVGDVLQANLGGGDLVIRSAGDLVTLTNAPERLIQDRMADWRAPIINEAADMASLEGAQLRFHAQPARDKEPGRREKISAGHVRFQPDRIDLAMQALPAREDGSLRVPTAGELRSLDRWVSLAEQPHVLSVAYHGAATMLEAAFKDSQTSRARTIASGIQYTTGVSADDLNLAFGEDANLSINTFTIRSMFDFDLGLTGVWEVRDHDKAAEIIDSLREKHLANLVREAENYGRSTDGLRFREEDHRGLTVLSAPLMIFPIQPSNPPTLNLALAEDVLLIATSRNSLVALIDRHLDGPPASELLERARAGHDLPNQVHSLGTADFAAFAAVFRRALPVIIALTQGGQETQAVGRAFADVVGSLGQGTATGIYQPEGQNFSAAILLSEPNPTP